MSWFWEDKTGSKEDVQQEPRASEPPLPAEAQGFLDNALRAYRDKKLSSGGVDRRIEDFVRLRTAQTIREWFTVEDEVWDKSNPPVVVRSPFSPTEHTWRGLCQGDVEPWADYWRSEADKWVSDAGIRVYHGERFSDGALARAKEDALNTLSAITDHWLDGAVVHHELVEELRKSKEKQERDEKYGDMVRRLETAATAPSDYACDTNAVAPVDEQSIYPDFATQIREHGFDESTVFDLLAQLSALVQQSRQILPRLTAEAVKQFEARVLLSYLKKLEATSLERLQESQRVLAANTSVSLDVRSSILEKEITTYANMGWRVTSRTATSAQLTKDKPPSWGTAILLALFFILPAVLYLILYKGSENLYLQVNERGEIIKSGTAG